MINKNLSNAIFATCLLLMLMNCGERRTVEENLAVRYQGDAQIEVGGPYVGASFHHSYMIPQRISFFYPVANSIDHSHDYWTRDTSFVANWKLKIGDSPAIEIGKVPAEFDLTPYAVSFHDNSENYSIKADYRFCHEKPAMVLGISIVNSSTESRNFHFETQLHTSIRTCHTFRWIERADMEIDENTIYTNFKEADADSAVVFIANAGDLPTKCSTAKASRPPFANFIYVKDLRPGEALNIVQIIGSSKSNERKTLVKYLRENYQTEIDNYEKFVREQSYTKSVLKTGSSETDHSVAYAKAVLAANAHYLDGEIVPMPCPAEYNFYFTHDVLVTDLAAVNFDPERVKRDLDYIIRHADENHIIPHAYYWKDGKYVTEYASSDNWNNFWFVQLSAKYLRHAGDLEFLGTLYPFIMKSIERSLLTLEDDHLMWSYRPDWWDIGHNYGPRSYMTILAIKTMRDYNFISTVLGKNPDEVKAYTALADSMQTALVDRLWSDELNYLINYNDDGSPDKHYYIGSLLAAPYGLIDHEKQNRLVQTAKAKLLDEKVGIYNVFPIDFHLLGDFYKFVGNEVGAQYYYLNGGVWSQGNAWYALALIANNEKQAAADFIAQTMSLHGIMNGPNGQPAYYEVRNANKENPAEYGTVDKPNFLWAGAWYLNSLYQLYGVRENDWNIALDPFLPKDQKAVEFTLFVAGKPVTVNLHGKGAAIAEIRFDGEPSATLVFPERFPDIRHVDVRLGTPHQPYLSSTGAILESCSWTNQRLTISLRAYPGHSHQTVIIAPTAPAAVSVNGRDFPKWELVNHNQFKEIRLEVNHSTEKVELQLVF